MENIIAALASLVNTADAIRKLDLPNKSLYLNNLVIIANGITELLRDDIDDSISGTKTVDPLALSCEEKQMILDGSYIPAIKSLRERTGLGLKEAKDIVDKYRSKNMTRGDDGSWY